MNIMYAMLLLEIDMHSSTGAPELGPPSTPIQKLQHISFNKINERWLIYSGGCRTPPKGSDPSHVLSLYVVKKNNAESVRSLVPFGGRIVDFISIPAGTLKERQLFKSYYYFHAQELSCCTHSITKATSSCSPNRE